MLKENWSVPGSAVLGLVLSWCLTFVLVLTYIPSIMSFAATNASAWSICRGSWWGAFLCVNVYYPVIVVFSSVLAFIASRYKIKALAVIFAWAPFLAYVTATAKSGILNNMQFGSG